MRRIIAKIKEISKEDGASAELLALKATEELGEYAASLFIDSGYKSTKLTKEEIEENQIEEVVDIIICIMASLDKKGLLDEFLIEEMFDRKLKKWKKNLKKRNKKRVDIDYD